MLDVLHSVHLSALRMMNIRLEQGEVLSKKKRNITDCTYNKCT